MLCMGCFRRRGDYPGWQYAGKSALRKQLDVALTQRAYRLVRGILKRSR